MPGPNKKTIEELEKEVAELITKSGQCEQDILTDFKAYTALKKRINNPRSLHDDEDLHKAVYLKTDMTQICSPIYKATVLTPNINIELE